MSYIFFELVDLCKHKIFQIVMQVIIFLSWQCQDHFLCLKKERCLTNICRCSNISKWTSSIWKMYVVWILYFSYSYIACKNMEKLIHSTRKYLKSIISRHPQKFSTFQKKKICFGPSTTTFRGSWMICKTINCS